MAFLFITQIIMANTVQPNQPELIWDGKSGSFGGENRTTVAAPGTSSATLTLGGFVPDLDGTAVAPTGLEGGFKAFADDDLIGYFIVDIVTADGLSVFDENAVNKKGTVTAATAVLPAKYTFSATNDQLSGDSADLELVIAKPIYTGDILEVSLFNDAGTATVARGTTTAYGTTGSSAHIGVGMAVNVTAQVGLTESTAAVDFADLDFRVVGTPQVRRGSRSVNLYPDRTDRVYVTPIRASWNATAAAQ